MSERKVKNISSVPVDGYSSVRITSVWTFLQSVDWSESWLIALFACHVICFAVTILCRKYYGLQICQFLMMVAMVYCAEYLNELAAMNWRSFSRFQYFDSKGMFISLVYSIPLLLNTVIIVAMWVWRTFSTMVELKTAQLNRKAAKQKQQKSQ